jgi:hypothetical protein
MIDGKTGHVDQDRDQNQDQFQTGVNAGDGGVPARLADLTGAVALAGHPMQAHALELIHILFLVSTSDSKSDQRLVSALSALLVTGIASEPSYELGGQQRSCLKFCTRARSTSRGELSVSSVTSALDFLERLSTKESQIWPSCLVRALVTSWPFHEGPRPIVMKCQNSTMPQSTSNGDRYIGWKANGFSQILTWVAPKSRSC